jgi:hypothetical protein
MASKTGNPIIGAHTPVQNIPSLGSARNIFIVVILKSYSRVAAANRRAGAISKPAETFYMLGFHRLSLTFRARAPSTKRKIFLGQIGYKA